MRCRVVANVVAKRSNVDAVDFGDYQFIESVRYRTDRSVVQRSCSDCNPTCREKPRNHAVILVVTITRASANLIACHMVRRIALLLTPGAVLPPVAATAESGNGSAPSSWPRTLSAQNTARPATSCLLRWSITSCRTRVISISSGLGRTGNRCARRATTVRPRVRMAASPTRDADWTPVDWRGVGQSLGAKLA